MQEIGSMQFIGFGEAPPNPQEMIDNEQVLQILRDHGVDTKGKTGADTAKLVGINTRWRTNPKTTANALALQAAQAACKDATARTNGLFTPDQLRLINSGGSSRNDDYPACACHLQSQLGARVCEARDISLACCSWVDAVLLAGSRMRHKQFPFGMVAVGEVVGSKTNAPTSLNYCLWGDGGGAVVLRYDSSGDENYGVIADRTISDGQFADWTRSVGIGTHPDHRNVPYLDNSMEGHEKDIHKYAIRETSKAIKIELDDAGISGGEKAFLVPHYANLSLVEEIGNRIGITPERVLTRIAERGNTSSASIPITLAHYAGQNYFRKDDLLILAAFGGGMAISIILYRWP